MLDSGLRRNDKVDSDMDEFMVNKNRRELLTGGVRAGLLGLIGLAGGGAVAKRRRLLHQGKCFNRGLCCDCNLFDDCGLPAAMSAKLNNKV